MVLLLLLNQKTAILRNYAAYQKRMCSVGYKRLIRFFSQNPNTEKLYRINFIVVKYKSKQQEKAIYTLTKKRRENVQIVSSGESSPLRKVYV